MDKAVLVSGGAGFIGSQVCKALSKRGYTPVVIDSLVSGYESFVQWGPLVRADICNKDAVLETIAQYNPIAALHFAAFINVGESVQNPAKYYANNVGASIAYFQTLVEAGVSKIVFSSTAAVYGEPLTPSIDETHPTNPVNPYGQNKLIIENMLADFATAYGTKHLCFRYFNACGSDPEGQIGESHVPETHLIPLMLDAASGRRPPLTIFGNNYPTPDGTCIRDYVHVVDLAEAHVLGLDYLLSGSESITLNLGNGQGFSVLNVLKAAEKELGQPIPHTFGPRRDGDPAILVANATKAKAILGWTPQFPGLEDMIRHARQWRNSGLSTTIPL
ncbi:MAG: UDP-glucose 4-epimerase GalE [Candidatus Margulisiibacteriota bacterium]